MTQAALRREDVQATSARVGLKSLLLVGLKKEPVESLVPALRRRAIEVASTPSGPTAVAACRQRRYDLILVREPIADLAVEDLIAEIRRPGALCEHSYVQVVTGPARVEEFQALAGRQLSVCSVTDFGCMTGAISKVILGVSPRVALRIMAELMVRLDGGRLSRFCQVENVSESGLLIHTAELIPIGDSVEVALAVPGSAQPLRMTAKVVRHTGPHETVGFALKITAFQGVAERLWLDYLRTELTKDDTVPLGPPGVPVAASG